ncbi:MAG: flagellar filament capping protein FliD [Nitrospina sp.]|jgi:flagellar hook-associated protein 2|nr:flagellar filament capping protein FliD [Nitrospina sp.]MBT6602003.1 flagellar filament capping protein FliD [Nitrospina sp.]
MAQNAVFGINSNLDTQDIINKMVSLEARSMDLIEAKKQIEQQKLSSFQELKNRLQTFKSVVTTLNTESRFIVNKSSFSNSSSSDSNKVVDITTTSSATSGTYSLIVNNLATETKIISEGFPTTTSEVTMSSLVVTVGGVAKTINVDSSNNTVDGLRLAINNLGLDVKASFLNDGDDTNPIRLLISGNLTGASGAVTVVNPVSGIGTGALSGIDFKTKQYAQNASFTIDGVAVSKSSNTVSDVISGAALKLQSAGSGTISLSTDTDAITSKVSDFVDEYNEISLFLREQLALDPESEETGVLFGNFAVQNLQQILRSSISSEVTGISGDYKYLSQIGITTESDGSLVLDTDDLSEALIDDIQNVSQLFSSKGTVTHSSVAYVGFTSDTEPGYYDLKVANGVPQLSNSGAATFVNASGSGNFWAGSSGDATGLNFRISNLSNGDYGQVWLSIGVAEILNRQLENMVDSSLNGPLVTEVDTITETVDDFNITLLNQAERLLEFEESLKAKFSNLEIVLGRLNAQRDTFNSSLAGIQNIFSQKK